MTEYKNGQGETITPEMVSQELQKIGVKTSDTTPEAASPETKETLSEAEEGSKSAEAETERGYTDVEKEAMGEGWSPKGEKSAEEFLRAKPLYKKIHSQNREIKELRAKIDQLGQTVQIDKEFTQKKILEQLKEQKREAIKLGDVQSVEAIEMQERQYQSLANPQPQYDERTQKVLDNFKEKHIDWLTDMSYQGEQMKAFMMERDNQLAPYKLSPERHMEIIEKDLNKKFPDYFNLPEEKPKAIKQSVESDGNRLNTTKRKPTYSDLTEEQKTVAKFMERTTGKKIENYIDDLIKIGALSY